MNRKENCLVRAAMAAFWICLSCIAPAQTTSESVTTLSMDPVSSIPQMTTIKGLPHLHASNVPMPPENLRQRVMQYLESRAASLQDVHPDGSQILITTRFASTSQLHLVEKELGARFQLTFGSEPVSAGRFDPMDPQRIFITRDIGGNEFYQIFLLDRATGKTQMLTDGKSRHGSPVISEDGKHIAFSSNARNGSDTDVYYFSRTDAVPDLTQAKPVAEREGSYFPVNFSDDGSRLLVRQYRAIEDSDLYLVHTQEGRMEKITPESPTAAIGAAILSPDGSTVYYTTDRFGDFLSLYSMVVDGSTSEPKALMDDIPWNVEDITLQPRTGTLAASVNNDGMSQIYLLDLKSGKRTEAEMPEPGIAGSLYFPRQSENLFLGLTSSRSPSDVWHMGPDGKFHRWTQSEVGGLDTSGFIQPELVRYPAPGGIRVPAFYYPAPKSDKPAPVLVIFHGGPESQSRPGFSPFIQMLVKDLGIAVVVPNVRGSDGYGKKWLAMDNGIKREESLKDIGATLDWIASQPELDKDRVGVYGGSYGGYMVLCTAVFYPERIKAVVDVVGISHIANFLKNTQDYRRDLRRAEYGDERDPAVREVQERISPLNHADRIRAALYVQQGKNDPRVPQSEAEEIVQAARANGVTCWYLLADNEGHGFVKKENRDFALISLVQFLAEQLEVELH